MRTAGAAGAIGVLAMMLGSCAAPPRDSNAGAARAGERDCAGCPVLVRIPPGRFTMGAEGGEEGRPEGPPREVEIAHAFYLGRTEVTQREFARFVAATGHEPALGCRVWLGERWDVAPEASWRDPGYGRPPADDEPVTCVSWRDAVRYVTWLSALTGQAYRLPTEAEWEYAARGGTTTAWHWGDRPEDACTYANVYDRSGAAAITFGWPPVDCDDGFAGVARVGALAPNAFGLHDVLGNVWEWTQDCYVAPYPPAPVDGRAVEVEGACVRRTVRGGSWITRVSRNRVTFRGRDPEDARYAYFGFRVARD
jgi:formylglycine-generating enzyme required for sulfatase activity